jgi:hypothetical protein
MVEPERGGDVLVERGAVLAIAGCVLLYIAFLASIRYDRAPPMAGRAILFLGLLGGWCIAAGVLGLGERPESTRLAGGSYAAAGWVTAAAGARAFATMSGVAGAAILVVALGLAALAELYGVALVRGFEDPADEDPLTRRVLEAGGRLLPGRRPRRPR